MLNILSDFLVRRPEGYYCQYGDFYIDAMLPVPVDVVSHGHGDHARPGHGIIYCTAVTGAIMHYRYAQQPLLSYRKIDFKSSFHIGQVELTFIPAGHILGSAQILMEYKGVRYLYTGDYKLQEDETCEPIEIVQADVLITECTFADPDVIHPDPIAEIKKLNEQPFNILLGTYALGKAQRLTDLINKHCPDRRVLVHHGILPLHRIYDDLGPKKLVYGQYNRREMKVGEPNKVYMVPPMTFNSYIRATNVVRAFASGWKRLQQHNDLSLFISDHVDWNDILYFIQAVKPQEVWTLHGDGRILKQHFEGNLDVRDIY